MRVSIQTKQETRQRILECAHKLFIDKSFEQASTRQIASRAGIATGTLFNYFASKEALGVSLLAEAVQEAAPDAQQRRKGHESLEEDLFIYISACLRRLEPHRSYLPPIVESTLSPFTQSAVCPEAERIRVEHLEHVASLLNRHSFREISTITLHLYWTLFLGVLAYWSRDESPKQEDTLALLDQSLRLFVASLSQGKYNEEVQ